MKKEDKLEVQDLEPGDVIWVKGEWLIVETTTPTSYKHQYALEVKKLDGSERKTIFIKDKKEFTVM